MNAYKVTAYVTARIVTYIEAEGPCTKDDAHARLDDTINVVCDDSNYGFTLEIDSVERVMV